MPCNIIDFDSNYICQPSDNDGEYHIESASMSTIGSRGWVDTLIETSITASGKADTLLQCSHINRTRYAHELTLASLYAPSIEAHSEHEGIGSLDAFCLQNKDIGGLY